MLCYLCEEVNVVFLLTHTIKCCMEYQCAEFMHSSKTSLKESFVLFESTFKCNKALLSMCLYFLYLLTKVDRCNKEKNPLLLGAIRKYIHWK